MRTKKKTYVVSVRISEPVRVELKRLAELNQCSLSVLLRQLLTQEAIKQGAAK